MSLARIPLHGAFQAMLDPASGVLRLPASGLVLGPRLPMARLKPYLNAADEPNLGSAPATVGLGQHRLAGVDVVIRLQLYARRVEAIELSALPGPLTGQDEDALHRFHERWLIAQLGVPGGRFPWGEVLAQIDPRSAESLIVVRYAWLGAPWLARTASEADQ